ncbi:hypothetical protein SprV_0100383700 [Sparganum proliferum]
MVKNLHHLPYEARLTELNLFPLNYRQLRVALIQTYRIVRGRECALDSDKFFEFAGNDRLRGHPFKLEGKLTHSDVRRNALSHRVIGAWDELPDAVVLSETIESFNIPKLLTKLFCFLRHLITKILPPQLFLSVVKTADLQISPALCGAPREQCFNMEKFREGVEVFDSEFADFEQKHFEYVNLCEEIRSRQQSCLHDIKHYRLYIQMLTNEMQNLKDTTNMHEAVELSVIKDRFEAKKLILSEMEQSLPKKNGPYLSVVLGAVDVSFTSKQEKFVPCSPFTLS